MVCLPKSNGGLGVLNIKTQDEALMLKCLDKFFNRKDIPWVHLIWEKYYNNYGVTFGNCWTNTRECRW